MVTTLNCNGIKKILQVSVRFWSQFIRINRGRKMKCKNILIKFIKDNRWSYIVGIITLFITSFVAMIIPKILGVITDGLDGKSMMPEEIYKNVALMMLIVIAVFILKYSWRYLLIGNCRKLECYLRDSLFKHLQTLPVSFYNNYKTGDLVAHAINDVQAIRITFGFGSIHILDGVSITLISILFMTQTINPKLTFFALAPVPIAVFIMIKIGNLIRLRFKRVQEAFSAISEKVQENIAGIRVIKAFSQEDEEVNNFLKYSHERVDSGMKLTKVSAALGPCTSICFGISFLLYIVYGSNEVIKGVISLGDYIAFNSYMMAIMGPVMHISRIIDVWERGIASYKRLDKIFSAPPGIVKNEEEVESCKIHGSIKIRNLCFSYPGATKNALENINIRLDKGKTLGIIGKTGSGKTTLINLLLRLYEVDEGQIYLDGTDINNIPVNVLRESIGCVPQENFLFSTTIRNNIEFFKNIYSDDEIEEAAKLSGVYENIASFPDGFETIVGERGATLSGGQKQRISIARALVKNPSILILDDSLSAVDTKTEDLILGNIKKVLKDRTGIIVSHRVSTVMHANEIIPMDDGKIIKRGTHKELNKQKGYYQKLYEKQNNQ